MNPINRLWSVVTANHLNDNGDFCSPNFSLTQNFSLTTDAVAEIDRSKSTGLVDLRPFLLVAACFMLSGFAALLYETVWLRQFAIVLGTSEQALAVILGSYMGGLALGAAIAARFVDRVTRPLLTYGLLEAGIALSALAVPIGLMVVRSIQSALFGGYPEPVDAGSWGQVLFAFVSTFSLILLPTTMMGATLPLLTKHVVHRNDQLGWQIALLYAINTAGAVVGTLTAAFVCLPALGLSKTVWVGVAANLLVFVLVCLMARIPGFASGIETPVDKPDPKPTRKQRSLPKRRKRALADSVASRIDGSESTFVKSSAAEPDEPAPSLARMVLWLVAISGAASFCYEIVFTRMLGHLMGGSIFAFSTMLAGFLLGIAIGSTLAARFCRTRRIAAKGFAYAQCGAGICSLIAYRCIDSMASKPPGDDFGGTSLAIYVTTSILALTPTAIFIGSTFPFAIRIFAKDEHDAARGSATVYLWNTVGAIIGAMVTGAWLLPSLQYEGTALLAILVNLSLALAAVLLMRIGKAHLAVVAAALVVAVVFRPPFPTNVLRRSGLAGHPVKGKLIHTKVGRSATVALFDQRGYIQVRTNGLPEAATVPKGSARNVQGSAVWLAALPPLMRPQCESMLIVGLGGGVAAANVPPTVKQIDVFELEPAVVEANRIIGPMRDSDPMQDARLRVIMNDGRNGLHLTTKKYDSIVSQPSHPWTAGASHLFTREFARIARDHLTDDGVFLQWMASEFVDVPLARSMMATLRDVFPHVRLYSPIQGELLFIAGHQKFEPEKTSETESFIAQPNRRYYRSIGVRTPSDLFSMLKMDEQGGKEFAADAPVITDDNNLFAVSRSASRLKDDKDTVHQAIDRFRPIMRSDAAARELCPTLDISSLLQLRAWEYTPDESQQLLARIEDPIDRLLREATMAKSAGDVQRWADLISESCNKYPEDPRAAFTVLSDHLMGSRYALSEKEVQQLLGLLDDRHLRIVEAIFANNQRRFDLIQQRDDVLLSVEPGEPAFPYAANLRSYWRLHVNGPDRVKRAQEAIDLIETDMSFINAFALSWLRTRAGVIGGRPLIALATTQRLAEAVEDTLISEDIAVRLSIPGMLTRLQQCRNEIDDLNRFTGVSDKRYREVREFVDDVLARGKQLQLDGG